MLENWQANRRADDPTPDGDTTEMDWDEFEFAVNKVCEHLQIDPGTLVEPRSAGTGVANVARLQQKMKGMHTRRERLLHKNSVRLPRRARPLPLVPVPPLPRGARPHGARAPPRPCP
jgi:hypothetical protein